MDISSSIALQIHIRPEQIQATIELIEANNTLPFIARYRKEVTGGLDEEQIRQIGELLVRLRAVDDRRRVIRKSIEEQGRLTPVLREQLLEASSLTALEDLYRPYKPKRRTRASIAREKGLQPLADLILKQARLQKDLSQIASFYLNAGVQTVEEAWAGACDIAAEIISDEPQVRRQIREKALQWGMLNCEKVALALDERGVYSLYYEFEQRVDRLRPHQVLAINRGEQEKILRVRLGVAERDWLAAVRSIFPIDPLSPVSEKLQWVIADAAERLILPSIERDVRRWLTEKAAEHAIHVFASNLSALLSQPPLVGYTVLGIDPGLRTGCKLAIVDPQGKLLETATIYPHEPHKQWEASVKTMGEMVRNHRVELIAIGNGTASRETEVLVAELIQRSSKFVGEGGATRKAGLAYLITSEAGASVYSASPLARVELPGLDVSLRGAVSIARRIQDPLAELVKIDPKSIGVGLYQHDVDQKQLAETLSGVVESVVNQVGVDVNTASSALLAYVAGIGLKLAERIVAYRDEHGPYSTRKAIKEVPGMGPKAFEQAAGFLRIRDGYEPLDASSIHPESYETARTILNMAGLDPKTLPGSSKEALEGLLIRIPVDQLALKLGCGVHTLLDILEQLARPGRDPRQELPPPVLRNDVLKMEDLAVGMRLKGTVRNMVDFGAFVDVGVKQDGLLHRSQLPPGLVLRVGDVIEVVVLKVEAERSRIALGCP